jgi:hypothetical protein
MEVHFPLPCLVGIVVVTTTPVLFDPQCSPFGAAARCESVLAMKGGAAGEDQNWHVWKLV